PHALATVAGMSTGELDRDSDGRVSIWELFLKTVETTEARFASDGRVATEHAQLDDDGDGRSIDAPDPNKDESQKKKDKDKPRADGALAKSTLVPRGDDKDKDQ